MRPFATALLLCGGLLLAEPFHAAPPVAAAAVQTSGAPAAASPLPAEPGHMERRCGQDRATTAFGWTLIAYGVATLKYVVGLLLIMLGGIFVPMGWLLSAVQRIWCRGPSGHAVRCGAPQLRALDTGDEATAGSASFGQAEAHAA